DPLDPGFGFDAMRLAVPHAEPLVQGQVTLDTRDHQDEGVSALIDRLAVRFGAHAIQSLEPCDAHLPEHTQCVVLGGSGRDPRAWPSPAPGPSPARPLHLFDPAQPIEMAPLSSEDEPSRFRWRRVRHLIRKAQGPERIAAPWWSTALPPPTRDYWRVEIDDGRRYWLFRQTGGGADDRWFLHGVFA
ncbi:MAG: DNA polymerase Y family protein, partial [Hyphomicrobium sp.]